MSDNNANDLEHKNGDPIENLDENPSETKGNKRKRLDEENSTLEEDTNKKNKVDEENTEPKEIMNENIESEQQPSQSNNPNTTGYEILSPSSSTAPQTINTTNNNPTTNNTAVAGLPAGQYWRVASQSPELMILEIPQEKVGSIIGSKGMIIQEIQMRSGAQALVHQNFPNGVPRQVELKGSPTQINAAFELIKRIIEQGPTAIHVNSLTSGPMITSVLECSLMQVGKIIGSNGTTIKEIQSKSGAKIQIDQDFPPEIPRKINIMGTSTAVNIAVQLVQNLMTQGNLNSAHVPGAMAYAVPSTSLPGYYSNTPGGGMGGGPGRMMHQQGMMPQHQQMHHHQQPPQHHMQHQQPGYPPQHHQLAPPPQLNVGGGPGGPGGEGEMKQVLDVPKSVVGKIIGKAGETIQFIQKKAGCRVTVDQNVPEGHPCKVNMTGIPYNLSLAQAMIQEIMMGIHTSKLGLSLPPPMVPPGGGGGGMGGGGMGGGYGGAMAHPSPMTAASYGLPAGYGGGIPATTAAPQTHHHLQGYGGAVGGGYPPVVGYGPPPQQLTTGAVPTGGYGGYGLPSSAPSAYGMATMTSSMGGYGGSISLSNSTPLTASPALNTMNSNAAGGAVNGGGGSGKAASATVWTEYKDDDGRSYWYNSATGTSQWERPNT